MLKKILIFTVGAVVVMQLIPLDRTNPKIDETVTLHTDKSVMKILKTSCYDCHSNETKWSDYAYIAPLSFGVVEHVEEGREALNFSNWKKIPDYIKKLRLEKAIEEINEDEMPLPTYTMFHKDAVLTPKDKEILKKWCEKELYKVRDAKL